VGVVGMSDASLSEFQRASDIDAGPEHSTKHELTEWLDGHGAGVLWEESNPWGHPTFEIERDKSGGVPDLVVLLDEKTFVVEYKTGDAVGQVYDSLPQLLGYWLEHIQTDQRYMAGGTELRIDGFLTATANSHAGRLFPRYAEKRQDFLDMDETRQGCYDWGQLPPAEYRMTEQHVRTLWRGVKLLGDIFDLEDPTDSNTPHVGSLLSDVLVEPSNNPSPAVLWNKSRHNQCWEVLD